MTAVPPGRKPTRTPSASPSRLAHRDDPRQSDHRDYPRGEATMPRHIIPLTTLLLTTVALMLGGACDRGAAAGTATPDVAGTWEGTWRHRQGSGQIMPRLAQEGTTVTGRQRLVGSKSAIKIVGAMYDLDTALLEFLS